VRTSYGQKLLRRFRQLGWRLYVSDNKIIFVHIRKDKMSIFNRLFGFRWSLYVVKNDNQLVYALHEHSALCLADYVGMWFAKGAAPVQPWSLYLNFNHTHKNIKLGPQHFSPDGRHVTQLLIDQIRSIDPGFDVRAGEPLFVEVATKKQLKLREELPPMTRDYLVKRLAELSKPREQQERRESTFYNVMESVFGKDT